MPFRLVNIIVPEDRAEGIGDCLKGLEPQNWWRSRETDMRDRVHFVAIVEATHLQDVLDTISERMEGTEDWQLVAQAVEAVLPEPEEAERDADEEARSTREEIFENVRLGAQLSVDYLLKVALAIFVAAIGLNSDQVAVVIGAMVIAPLLGPILAFSFGTALGNRAMLLLGAKALGAGLVVGIALAVGLGLLFPVNLDSSLMDFSAPLGLDNAALPLASGAAAALMVARGETSGLVGVMVAAALLPPVTAFGLLVGAGHYVEAGLAMAIVMANIVAINLAGQLVFLWKGVRPRRWNTEERETSVLLSLGTSAFLMAVTVAVILYFGDGHFT